MKRPSSNLILTSSAKRFFPNPDDDVVKKRKFFLRGCSLLSATYAYYRRLIRPEAFKFETFYSVSCPVFNLDHPRGRKEAEAFKELEKAMVTGELKTINYGAFSKKNEMDCCEVLKFDFFFDTLIMELPNSPQVRVDDILQFVSDFESIVLRIRSVCSFLSDFETPKLSGMMCYFKTTNAMMPGFKVCKYKPFVDQLKSIPLASIPFHEDEGSMVVSFHSKYFEGDMDQIAVDVKAGVDRFDEFRRNNVVETDTVISGNGDVSREERSTGQWAESPRKFALDGDGGEKVAKVMTRGALFKNAIPGDKASYEELLGVAPRPGRRRKKRALEDFHETSDHDSEPNSPVLAGLTQPPRLVSFSEQIKQKDIIYYESKTTSDFVVAVAEDGQLEVECSA